MYKGREFKKKMDLLVWGIFAVSCVLSYFICKYWVFPWYFEGLGIK